jgi:hypothetical protein
MIDFSKRKEYIYPFDYFVIDDCFKDKDFNKLVKEWPVEYLQRTGKAVMGGRKQISNLKAFQEASPTWKALYDHLNSDDILGMFKGSYESSMQHWGCTLSEEDTIANNKMYLHIDWSEANDGYVREIHADSAKRFVNFLIFFNDKTWKDGDFIIHSSANVDKYYPPQAGYRDVYSKLDTRIHDIIEAKKNRAVFFLSSPNSLHSVSKQSNTTESRKFIYGAYSSRDNSKPVFTNYENKRL